MPAAQEIGGRGRTLARLFLWVAFPLQTHLGPGSKALLFLHQWSWGLLNTLVGLAAGGVAVMLLHGRVRRRRSATVVLVPGRRWFGVALGPVLLVSDRVPAHVLDHETGHWLQSILLGPFYWPVIGLPSVLHALWFRRQNRAPLDYYRFYTESWADRWGGVRTVGGIRRAPPSATPSRAEGATPGESADS